MLHDIVRKGSTDRSVTVKIIDSTDGTPETGVVFNTSGIDLWYRREGAAKTTITEATLAALTTAHTDGGFLHISDGVYRLDLPDAAFATGANYVDFGGTVTGMIVIGGRVRLIDADFEAAILTETEVATAVWASATRTLTDPVLPSGTVVSDAGNSATVFVTDRTETTADYWKDALLLITSGVLSGQVKKITAYNGTTKAVTVENGFTGTPAAGVTFLLVNR